MSSPAGTWLQDLALAVRVAGKLGERMRAYQLLSVVLEAGIKTTGVAEDLDLADDVAFKKGSQAIGMQMSRAFKGESITADDITITRFESEDAFSRPVKEYEFTATNSPQHTASPSPELVESPEVKRGFPEPPEVLQTFAGARVDPITYESVTGVRELRENGELVREVPKCNHQDPASWRHDDGKAFCPGCGKWMGNTR